ncbi:MAG: branched-chain amino acid ABC transporter permease [Candidatus Marinimicrobia bacterium]|nr:branched-chain amino acid ABC transporter permease [Candidatus Neomarinimicrobiota bacterium]
MDVQIIIYGLTLGSVYALVALGLVVIYRATEIINFAQGEMMMLSAYVFFTLSLSGTGPFLAVAGTLLFAAFLGVGMNLLVSRPLIGKPVFAQIMATIALSILLRSIAGIVWSHEDQYIDAPVSMILQDFGWFKMSPYQGLIILVTLGLVVVFYLFLKFTLLGTSIKATSEDPVAAQLMGIPIKRVYMVVWIVSGIVSAVAGILISPQSGLHPTIGIRFGMKALPAAVLGGFGSLPGAIVGGITLGMLESMAIVYLPTAVYDIFPWVVLILVLLIRPEGILGVKKRKRV